MKTILVPLLTTLADLLRSRVSLHLEMLALRQKLAMVANRDNRRHRFRPVPGEFQFQAATGNRNSPRQGFFYVTDKLTQGPGLALHTWGSIDQKYVI